MIPMTTVSKAPLVAAFLIAGPALACGQVCVSSTATTNKVQVIKTDCEVRPDFRSANEHVKHCVIDRCVAVNLFRAKITDKVTLDPDCLEPANPQNIQEGGSARGK